MILHRLQVEFIHEQLEHGDKRYLASFVGISYKLLSRYINYKKTKCFDGFKMPNDVYDKIMHFIHLKTIAEFE